MSKYQVGDKVRILNVDFIEHGHRHFNTGDVTEVTRLGSFNKNPVLKSTEENDLGELYISSNELEYIAKSEELESIFQRVNTLEKEVAELKKIVEGYKKPLSSQTIKYEIDGSKIMELIKKETPQEPILPQSNNQKRAAIIEKANKFLAKELPLWNYYKNEFVVNKEKRTVVVLRKDFETGNVVRRGIAKCHPSDVFNEYLGKAIAFGRATTSDVSEFENAVQPDEFEVGQLMLFDSSISGKQIRTITEIKDNCAYTKEAGFFYCFRINEPNFRIINDTNAQY